MSSFSGKIKEYPQISVDRFDGRHLASTAYFLSHHHSDHMHGLSSPQFLDHLESNSGVYLYCSPITAKLLQTNIRYRPLSPFIRPLQIEESVKITIPNIAEDAGQHLWVTLIPAAHCPGSVMFLFEGRGGTVLYTGDFRLCIGEASRIGPLHLGEGTVRTIDHLHIDTTFCHKDIMKFPSREESLTALLGLVEDWLARGNNYLIHLVCPAKYGYEFVYRGIHERFGMKIHVSHWKYRMYASVPEILAILTSDATETWIHACDGNTKEINDVDDSGTKQLPCHCVPYGVDAEPNIRVIRPSAMYFALYQSVKEIKQVSSSGTFCRVLLSMHASCSEILDLVSYLRPRKVSPNVIPFNSTREEVLKLLHEALNRAGDHYSIEYVSNQRRSMGSFKRQLEVSDSSSNSGGASNSMLEAGMLDSFMSSPNKKRRHSDSNMTLLIPTPRGNIKGSLSLEGEARHDLTQDEPDPDDADCDNQPQKELVWQDPYSQSPTISQSDVDSNQNENTLSKMSVDCISSTEHIKRNSSSSKYSSRLSATTENDDSSNALKINESQDSIDLCSVFSDEDEADDSITRPASSNGVAGESNIKRSRRLWYKHKYFSTPVHEETDGQTSKMVPRSSSLPDQLCLDAQSEMTEAVNLVPERVPLITVSSPLDHEEPTSPSPLKCVNAIIKRCSSPDLFGSQEEEELDSNFRNIENFKVTRSQTVGNKSKLDGYPNRYLDQMNYSTVNSDAKNGKDVSKNLVIDATSTLNCIEKGVSTSSDHVSHWIPPIETSHDRQRSVSAGSSDIEEVYCSVAGSRPSVICAPILKKEELAVEEETNGKWIDCGLPKLRNKYRKTSSVQSSVKRKLSGGPQFIDISEESNSCCTKLELDDACPRSSCLKTAKRNRDEIHVFTLDRTPL